MTKSVLRLPIVRLAATVACGAVLLSGCTSTSPGPSASARAAVPIANKTVKSKEYFSEAAYGVKASPRVTAAKSRLRRGGGRDHVGKPYKVKGKWYTPKEEPGYSKTGKASWYGSAFHGRLTANGEVYDMTHLTAAHPTMPLPSYARVTNLANGSSVIVRVNDRGPFAHGRVIDLSKKAAQMLGYIDMGVADVQVDYVGRAPLEGRDDDYLFASYQPAGSGPQVPQPSSDVMIAMNGTTPAGMGPSAAEMAIAMTADGAPAAHVASVTPTSPAQLPDAGPMVQVKLPMPVPLGAPSASPATSFAKTTDEKSDAFSYVLAGADRVSLADEVLIGTFATIAESTSAESALAGVVAGARIETDGGSRTLFVTGDSDAILARAWELGYDDAFAIRR